MNDNLSPVVAVVPLIPLRRAEGMAAEIEALMRRAEAEGRARSPTSPNAP
jgi:hypothetical protein